MVIFLTSCFKCKECTIYNSVGEPLYAVQECGKDTIAIKEKIRKDLNYPDSTIIICN